MIHHVLRLLRTVSNLKQQELADELKISIPYLSQIESGVRPATSDLIDKYCEVFDLRRSTLDFFIDEQSSHVKPSNSRKFFQRQALRLLQLMEHDQMNETG